MTSDLVYIESKLQLSRCFAIGHGMKKPDQSMQFNYTNAHCWVFKSFCLMEFYFFDPFIKHFDRKLLSYILHMSSRPGQLLGGMETCYLKLRYFENATKIWNKPHHIFLTLLIVVASKKRLFQKILTFSECLNFLSGDLSEHDLGQKKGTKWETKIRI